MTGFLSEKHGLRRGVTRETALDQLVYLVDELESLATIIDRLPEIALEWRPVQDTLSVKEFYGLIAERDAERIQFVKQITEANQPDTVQERSTVSRSWNALPMQQIIQVVSTGRTALYNLLSGLQEDAWSGQLLLKAVIAFINNDTEILREVCSRLNDASLFNRKDS